ncbi:PREDICTED: DNA repair protein XRCC2 homolog isoform X2 [Nelumbo nucifera]|uniref:DNA repair protein XRCC2 homolog isoform X2 n=1 Tax=Nelumbo nucifera TaxID=4432 RepID=A0A1U8A3G8_NELNU|nr:PREDICTED: DNA repair protein XRCC2 homolog isoform X2 [Nelumbo nucifera]
MSIKEWINTNESAKEMLERVLTERPFLLLPPLHRVPLRVGNVVEIVGPSPSAKTEILIQAAISCVLPKQWNGVHYGGLERLVMYIDLDCRFDILRLSQSLKLRIMETKRSSDQIDWSREEGLCKYKETKETIADFDEDLFLACMRRFLYVCCYNSFEFLSTLKTLHYQLQKESEAHGVAVHFLMIDSISAFYWIDRASTPLPLGFDKRKSLSLQTVAETVVQEIRKLLQMQPMLVLVTKATLFGDGSLTSNAKRTFRKWHSQDTSYLRTLQLDDQKYLHHEECANAESRSTPIYVSEWLLPSLSFVDKFMVKDAGISMVT